MDIDAAVGDFDDPIELPSKTMRWCLAHAEEALPRFVDILRRHNAGGGCSAEEEGSIFFVVSARWPRPRHSRTSWTS